MPRGCQGAGGKKGLSPRTHVDIAIPHVVHANSGAGIVMRLPSHVLGHHGAHPVDQALGGILSLHAADRHVDSGSSGCGGGHGSGS